VTRTKRSTDLDSITRRKPLAIGEHHQETLGRGRYLQYHKPVGGAGTWIVRGYDPKTRKITQARLGEADDFTPADGTRTLTYAQARAKAEKWALDRAAVPVKKDEFQPALRTVREVVANYIETARMERKKAATAEADRKALETGVLPELGDIPVAELTASRIETWRNELASRGRRKTGPKRLGGKVIEYLPMVDPELAESMTPTELQQATEAAMKRRKSSANRYLAILKAALNLAAKTGKIDKEHMPWAIVAPFRGVKGQRIRFLSLEEQRALVRGCDDIFRPLVQGALLTGARYGELVTAKVSELDLEGGTLWVDGKGQDSRPRYIVLTEEGVEFFKELSKGRGRGELLFLRPGVNRKGGRDRHVILNNTRIRLSPGEDALLRILVERAGGLVLYSELASRLPNVMPDPRKATVRAMNTVEQVRHKLQHQGRPQFLRGGGGVRFALPDSDSLEFEEASEAVPEAPATVLGGWLKDDAQGPIRKAYTAAGLEPLTFHELRHTYASALINRGVPLVFVAQQLGHADTRMVEEHYGHLCETAKRDAIMTLAPRIFSPQAKTVETEPEPPSRSRKRR
jgi:integrase